LFATLPGVSAPPPFGSSQRTILVRLDPNKLRSYNMSPDEVVRALAAGNTVSPSGNVRIGDLLPMVPVNSVVGDFRGLSDIPIRSQGTQTIFIRDVGSVEEQKLLHLNCDAGMCVRAERDSNYFDDDLNYFDAQS
jgi:multidrug efflux pump subunit AcrB